MDTLLSVSMSLLGQVASSVPKTPPQPARRPLGNLTNVCATPDSCGATERRRPGERRRSETLADDTPPTPMTNLKLLTNIAASQPAGTRKTLFAAEPPANRDPAPPEAPLAGAITRPAAEPPMTPRGDENVPPPAAEHGCTPMQFYHSVFDTPASQDVACAKRAACKVRWRRRASDVLPQTAGYQTPVAPPPPPGGLVAKSRKDKSLSVLCVRFLEIYPLDVGDKEISLPLDETAFMLGTERRRIYDIVNVLESLHFSIRMEKNRYAWIGQRDLAATLGRLKGLAIHLDLPLHLHTALLASDGLASPAGVPLRRGCSEPALSVTPSPQLTPRTPCTPLSADAERLTPHDRGDRTLGVLTQKFVMLLLVSDQPALSQDVLARVLLGQDGLSPDGHHKAKVRRLYDIANILQSVGLVGKDAGVGRKPVFTYTGPRVEPIPVDPAMQRSRHSLIPTTPLSSRPTPAPLPVGRRIPAVSATPRPASAAAVAPDEAKENGIPKLQLSGPAARPGGLRRPASLDDICQVTAVERHRLFEQTIDGSRGKSVLKRRLAEVQRAQAEVKRARPQPPAAPGAAGSLSPAQHSQLSGLGIKRILIRAGDGSSQEICVRETRPAGDGTPAVGSRLEAALRGAWVAPGPAATPRPLAPRGEQRQVVAYQLVPLVRTVTAATPEATQHVSETPLPVLYDERAFLNLPPGVCLESAAVLTPPVSLPAAVLTPPVSLPAAVLTPPVSLPAAVLTPPVSLPAAVLTPPVSLPTATPESLLTPGTMTFVREAVSSGTIKTVCNMSLTPETTPGDQERQARVARARPAPRASRRLLMD